MVGKMFELSNKQICYVGKNKKDNWLLLDKALNENIQWVFFHLTSFSSPYLILETEFNNVTIDVVKEAAELLKQNTKYSQLRSVYVDFTPCSNIRKTENEGEIEYKSLRKVKKIRI